MKCENYFCIYQLDDICQLEEIDIDVSGKCTSCIYPEIDKKILDNAKDALLCKYLKSDE